MTDTPNRPPLSPAAQAVFDALYMDELNGPDQLMARAHAAAALRAAADQVVPRPLTVWDKGHAYCRHALLAIAAELEGNQAALPQGEVQP